jgi:hypothetical protein
MTINNISDDSVNTIINDTTITFYSFLIGTVSGPDHSIRECLLVLATLIGFFVHMKKKTPNQLHIILYLMLLTYTAYLIGYEM